MFGVRDDKMINFGFLMYIMNNFKIWIKNLFYKLCIFCWFDSKYLYLLILLLVYMYFLFLRNGNKGGKIV